MSYDTARPYLAVFVLLKLDNKIACLLRTKTDWMNGFYGLPAGKAEIDERAQTAAVREAKEEAGVNIQESDLKFVHMCHRFADDNTLAWLDIIFETEMWQGEPFNAEPHKHGELQWIDPANPPDNTVPAVKHYLQQIGMGNYYSEFNWEQTHG